MGIKQERGYIFMIDDDFKDAKKTSQFSYRQNPIHERSFMILEHAGDKGYEPVGDYTVLDLHEEHLLSEKKIMNLVALLNGESELIDLSKDTEGTRLYYQEVPEKEENDQAKVIFYRQDGEGISKENALFLINKERWGNA